MKDYHINIFYNEEDQGYIADIPDLKRCSAYGETPESSIAGKGRLVRNGHVIDSRFIAQI